MDTKDRDDADESKSGSKEPESASADTGDRPREIGGRGGLDPTRYGDWEKAGRCIDF